MTKEYFDVLDENGGFTGEIIERDKAHEIGAWHRAVGLFIVNSKNQVLSQRRSKHKKLWPDCWDYTAGGHVDAGELGLASVVREAEEELGIKLDLSDVHYISSYRSDKKHGSIWDRHFNEYYIAFKDVDIKDIKLQEGEVEDIKWLDYKDFRQMIVSRDKSLTTKWECHDALVRYFDRYALTL